MWPLLMRVLLKWNYYPGTEAEGRLKRRQLADFTSFDQSGHLVNDFTRFGQSEDIRRRAGNGGFYAASPAFMWGADVDLAYECPTEVDLLSRY